MNSSGRSDRDDAAECRDSAAAERDDAADARDETARVRDDQGRQREKNATDRFRASHLSESSRDQQDQSGRTQGELQQLWEQAVIDREMAIAHSEMVRHELREALSHSRNDRLKAAADREASLKDRADSAADRAHAAAERAEVAAEKARAAADKDQAEIDAEVRASRDLRGPD